MAEQTIGGRIYPIGIQSFQKIIEEGYTYVDKTFFVAKLVKETQYVFLSRPRRFGKSLLLSTIHAYFDGRRDLFKGLAIDKMDMDWTPRPVLHFDLNTGKYDQPEGLLNRLSASLTTYEGRFGILPSMESDPALRFENLINGIHQDTGKKVVILVDEYDKPLLGIEENPELYEKNQRMLKGFFSNLKSMDDHIEFAMLTGVARFSKVSIFSDLNNLDDISMESGYANICGWTEAELTDNFEFGIRELAKFRAEEVSLTIKELREYYDGYLFAPNGSRLYNPFSILKALKAKAILPYWFDTGTPTFLANRIRKEGIDPESLNGQTQSYSELIAVGLGTNNVIALMFQTGYLTIDSYDARRQIYTLRFPNREVEVAFAQNLLPLYVPATSAINGRFNLQAFKDNLYYGDPYAFMERLQALFKDLPVEDHRESTYRAVTYLLCLLSGTEAIPERHSYKGRSDLEVLTTDYVYVFEFKYDKSVEEAMEQIHSRDYAGRYALDPRTVYLIGANFNEKKEERGLQYEIERMEKN
ncbi:MAG: ATP-binding protein [Muribaculaceae bacterium]|nr:ATP-binding protein [Muribaculaceae bacterium]